jgi:hypothetical protein
MPRLFDYAPEAVWPEPFASEWDECDENAIRQRVVAAAYLRHLADVADGVGAAE